MAAESPPSTQPSRIEGEGQGGDQRLHLPSELSWEGDPPLAHRRPRRYIAAMPNLLLVMLGGAIGAGLRFQVGRIAQVQLGPHFPWGTWIVNLAGGFLMGVLVGSISRGALPAEPIRLFLSVGVLGGFTTFSAFSLDAANMLQRGELAMAGAYAVSSFAGSVMLLFVGLWMARAIA